MTTPKPTAPRIEAPEPLEAGELEDSRGIVNDRVDTGQLLKESESDANDEGHSESGSKEFGLPVAILLGHALLNV